jgi:hypothetical protein
MPATRARSIAPRFDSYKPASTTSTKPSSPLTVKRKDGTQPKERPQKLAIDPSDIIEISDDDEPLRHLDSQTSKIANFRRQINMLREVFRIFLQFNQKNVIVDASGGSGKCQAQERVRVPDQQTTRGIHLSPVQPKKCHS